jgi:hypothetical protein
MQQKIIVLKITFNTMEKIRHYFFNLKTAFRRIFATWRLPQKSSMTDTKGFSWKKKWHQKSPDFEQTIL